MISSVSIAPAEPGYSEHWLISSDYNDKNIITYNLQYAMAGTMAGVNDVIIT